MQLGIPAWFDVQEQFVDSWLAPKTPVALESLTRALSGSWALWVPQEVQSTSLKLTRKRASWDLLARSHNETEEENYTVPDRRYGGRVARRGARRPLRQSLPKGTDLPRSKFGKKDGVSFSGATAGAAARWTCGKSVQFRP